MEYERMTSKGTKSASKAIYIPKTLYIYHPGFYTITFVRLDYRKVPMSNVAIGARMNTRNIMASFIVSPVPVALAFRSRRPGLAEFACECHDRRRYPSASRRTDGQPGG